MADVEGREKLTLTRDGYRPLLTVRYLREHTGWWANYGGWHAGCTCGFKQEATGEIDAKAKTQRHLAIANSQLVQSKIFDQ